MLFDIAIHGPKGKAFSSVFDRCDRITRHRLSETDFATDTLSYILATARFSPGLELRLSGIILSGSKTDNLVIAHEVPFAAQARALAAERVGVSPEDPMLSIVLHLDVAPYFLARYNRGQDETATHADASPAALSPAGQMPVVIARWFDATLSITVPQRNGSLKTARGSASAYALQAKADNTRKAYRAGVRAWCAWADRHALPCLPARSADIAAFLADERGRGLAPATLELRRAAITYLHRLAGCAVPTADAAIGETMTGIRRTAARDGFTPRRKAAATQDVLAIIISAIDLSKLSGMRDRALLLMGFYGALRRSELASIDIRHVTVVSKGLLVTLPQSKGDRQGKGVEIALPYTNDQYCPVKAYGAWLAVSGIQAGPIFRRVRKESTATSGENGREIGQQPLTDRSIARIIQSRASAAGLDGKTFGGHSLKRGALTTGMDAGAHPVKLKRLARHATYAALGDYLELGDPFDGHALNQ
ncbi:MAG: site-specific integrase [Acetobacter sp.]